MSLADELMADFEEGGDEEEELMEERAGEREMKEEDVGEVDETRMQTDLNANSIHNLAKLRDSKQVNTRYQEWGWEKSSLERLDVGLLYDTQDVARNQNDLSKFNITLSEIQYNKNVSILIQFRYSFVRVYLAKIIWCMYI